jgi:hypothetical protein
MALLVIAGLDPAIHADCQCMLNFIMDARVKPGHDEVISLSSASEGDSGGKQGLPRTKPAHPALVNSR